MVPVQIFWARPKFELNLMPCPFTGPKMFCAGPNFLSQPKNLTALYNCQKLTKYGSGCCGGGYSSHWRWSPSGRWLLTPETPIPESHFNLTILINPNLSIGQNSTKNSSKGIVVIRTLCLGASINDDTIL